MTVRVALIVPALSEPGGVRAVAEFIVRTIRNKTDFDLKIVSLAMSSRDACSTLVRRPSSWFGGIKYSIGIFCGEKFTHVGARFGDTELMRYRPRRHLTALLADCDLIQVVAGTPCWALPVVGLGTPVVLQVATLVSVERRRRIKLGRGFSGLWWRAMTLIVSYLDKIALRKVDAVLVENQWMLAHVQSAATEGRPIVSFAPPGIDTSLFSPAQPRLISQTYILTVGRFDDPRKNVGLLIDAYNQCCVQRANFPKLLIAGASPPPAEFWERAKILGLIDKIQFRENPSDQELADLYRNALCFVLTSDEEGLGLVVIEAMASGIPVVSTRSGGPDDIITDGVDGFLIDRDDIRALSDRLILLTETPDLNADIGLRARATALEKYSEDATGEAYVALYKQLLAEVTTQPHSSLPK